MKIDENTPIEELLDQAKRALNDVEKDERFLVKDLFRGFEWNRIRTGNRTKLGSSFKNFADTPNGLVKPVTKTPQNQWIYEKK